MHRITEMTQIRRLISLWLTEIGLANAESYFDINKVSEHLCRQLLNLIFDYELKDLNTKENPNFPGLDIGDEASSKVAFQITSRTDNRKVFKNLQTVVDSGYDKTFTSGIKFLILNAAQKIKFGKKAKQPNTILASFDPSRDILHPEDLIKEIEAIYEKEADLIKFNKVKLLLEKELSPKFPATVIDQQSKGIEAIRKLISERLKTGDKEEAEINVSSSFFDDNFDIPSIKNLVQRSVLASRYIELLQQHGLLWLHGPLSTGKTSIAVAIAQKLTDSVFWIECRGIKEEQLIEHILNALSVCLNIQVPLDARFKSAVSMLTEHFPADTTVILNDLPQLNEVRKTKDHFSYLAGEVIGASSSLLITSNFSIPESLTDDVDLPAAQEEIPPFNSDETADLLKAFGATDAISEVLKDLITTSTHGHPLLIRSAAKYLAGKEWKFNEEDLVAIFTGKFDTSTDHSTYAGLIEATTDEQTRELLYRLKYVIGGFDKKTADVLGAIEPVINRVGERLNELNGTWLQENSEGQYRVSPLIKQLGDNVTGGIKNAIYERLAEGIIAKKNISQIDASTAILYFSLSGKNNRAAIVMIRVLQEFDNTPEVFFDWGFDMHWYHSTLPEDMMPHFQVQIRVAQIAISTGREQDISYLKSDLEKIISQEGVELFDRYLGNNALFQLDFKQAPLHAMDKLIAIDADGKALGEMIDFMELFKDGSPLVDDKILNGIWLAFSGLQNINDVREWFSKLNPAGYPEQITDPITNDTYAMAGISIYRNIVLTYIETREVKAILKEVISHAIDHGFFLLATYSLKYLIKYLSEQEKDIEHALSLPTDYEDLLSKSDIYKFLVFAELSQQCYLNDKENDAFKYAAPLLELRVPDFYIEQFDFYMSVSQLYFKRNATLSSTYSLLALNMAKVNPLIVAEDKIKMYGEAAIGLAHIGKYKEALYALADGYEIVLNTFLNTDEYKAVVIRYGHTVLYVVQSMSPEGNRDFGKGEKFFLPEPGLFYRDNQKLLKGGFYFEERKFMVASITNDGFEKILDHENARKWAYKSIEMGTALNDAQFLPVIQKFIFFPVEDKQYRQAYNLLAVVEQFYQDLTKKVEEDAASKEGKELIARAQHTRAIHDDFGIYLFILFPAALDFSLRIVTGDLKSDQFQRSIDAVFENERYMPVNEVEFKYAKLVFEKIMITRIDYEEFKTLNNELKGSNKDFIYAIGCFLLSSFADATHAANLQLANVITLEKTFQTMIPAFYNFQVIPYFQQFWQHKFIINRGDFKTPDHLEEKGLPLIERTEPQKRVRKIFQVLVNHLPIASTKQIEDFIDPDL